MNSALSLMDTYLFKCLVMLVMVILINKNTYAGALIFNDHSKNDTTDIRNNRLRLSQLPKENVRYCIYNVTSKGKMVNTLIWEREIITDENDNFLVTQRWLFTDTIQNRISTALYEAHTLRPIFQKAEKNKRIEAFHFGENEIKKADTVFGNFVSEDFKVRTEVMPYNWEADFMLFSSLQIKKGRNFIIMFYHPGSSSPPDYYLYKSEGKELIKTITGKQMRCWKLRIDYSETSWAEFWIDKKSHHVIFSRDFINGGYRYKVLLPHTN